MRVGIIACNSEEKYYRENYCYDCTYNDTIDVNKCCQSLI